MLTNEEIVTTAIGILKRNTSTKVLIDKNIEEVENILIELKRRRTILVAGINGAKRRISTVFKNTMIDVIINIK